MEKTTPIDECPAGPWLDTAAARAMGWEQAERLGTLYWVDANGKCQYPVRDVESTTIGPSMSWQDGDYECGFNPSESDNDAMVLVRQEREVSQCAFSLEMDFNGRYRAAFLIPLPEDDPRKTYPIGNWRYEAQGCRTSPLAITRAFCKAHGIVEVRGP